MFSQLIAEEEVLAEPAKLYFELGEISAPLSFYTENWDPKEKLPLKLPGIRVEEKDLVFDLEKDIKASREEQDLLRSQNSWLSDSNPWIPPLNRKKSPMKKLNPMRCKNEQICVDILPTAKASGIPYSYV
ncbi:MAG: hypothetical protein WDZ28_01940 [Simkaniaceae bacterium]